MSPYNHHNGASGGKPSDDPQLFHADLFVSYVKKYFVDSKVITAITCNYSENNLIAHVFFGGQIEKFSFQFCVDFKSDIPSSKRVFTSLQKVIYEVPCTSPVEDTLNNFVFAILRNEIRRRMKGAFAEVRVVDLLKRDLAISPQLRILQSVTDYRVSDTDSDKGGIDLWLVVLTAIKRDFLAIDIKSYKNGLLCVRKDVAGLFVDESMTDQVILYKINILAEGFANGEYLRI